MAVPSVVVVMVVVAAVTKAGEKERKVAEKEKVVKEAAKARMAGGGDVAGAAVLVTVVVAWACRLQDMDIHLQDMVIHLQDTVIRHLGTAVRLLDTVIHLLGMVTHRQEAIPRLDMDIHLQLDMDIHLHQGMATQLLHTIIHLQPGMAIHFQAMASRQWEVQEVLQDAEDQALDQGQDQDLDLDQDQDQQGLLVCHLAGSSIMTLQAGGLISSIGRLAKQHGIRLQGHLVLDQHQDQDRDPDLDQDQDQDLDQDREQGLLVCHLAGSSIMTLQVGGLISSTGRLARQHGIRLQQETNRRRRLRLHLHQQGHLRQEVCPRAGSRQTTPKAASHITSTVPQGLQAGHRHSDFTHSLPDMLTTAKAKLMALLVKAADAPKLLVAQCSCRFAMLAAGGLY